MITGYYRVDEKMITFKTLSEVSNYSLTQQVNNISQTGRHIIFLNIALYTVSYSYLQFNFGKKKLQNGQKFPLTRIGLFNRVKERAIGYSHSSQQSLTIATKFHLPCLKVGFHV